MITTPQTFRIEAIPPAYLAAVRGAGMDEAGNPFVSEVNEDPSGAPLRCCLRMARVGEAIALIAYAPPGTKAAYREIGPVFVHAEPCPGRGDAPAWPPEFRNRRQVLRAYDRAGRISGALVIDANDAEAGIAQLFADPEVMVIHSRNLAYGCYMFAIRRGH